MNKIRLAIGLPCYRSQIHATQSLQWLSLGEALADNRDLYEFVYLQISDLTGVERNRNKLTLSALDDGIDVLIQCDSDNYVVPTLEDPSPGEAILRMVAALLADGRNAMVGAPIPTRNPKDPRLNVHMQAESGKWRQVPPQEFAGKVIEVDAVGTGLVAISVAWLRRCWPEPPWFETRCLPGRDLWCVGEDYHFCTEARKRGGKVLVDGRLSPIHGTGVTI